MSRQIKCFWGKKKLTHAENLLQTYERDNRHFWTCEKKKLECLTTGNKL